MAHNYGRYRLTDELLRLIPHYCAEAPEAPLLFAIYAPCQPEGLRCPRSIPPRQGDRSQPHVQAAVSFRSTRSRRTFVPTIHPQGAKGGG